MVVKNIIEYIKALLPTEIPLYLNEIPLGEFGLLIEETGIRGRIASFKGYDGVIQSTIQFYIRAAKGQGSYIENTQRLKDYFKIVQSNKGLEVDGIKLLWVDGFELAHFKDDKNNPCYSLLFQIIYKESESA